MLKFVCEERLAGYQRAIESESDLVRRRALATQLAQAQANLDLVVSAERVGVFAGVIGSTYLGTKMKQDFQDAFEASGRLLMLLDPRPGFHIVDANRPYMQATLSDPGRLAGERLFDAFPDNPEDPEADGVQRLAASIQTALTTRREHRMTVQRYDVRDRDGSFNVRFWKPQNTPLFDASGNVSMILHEATEVTERMTQKAIRSSAH